MKKICVVIGSRANYNSIKAAMRAIDQHKGLELQIIAKDSALPDRWGAVVNLMKKDGFKVNMEIPTQVEGETPVTMAKTTGLGIIELATALNNMEPDVVLTIGDRYETLATAVASAYMNIPLAHTMGGEVTGNIDESIRHAVTKFAHIHFPSSHESAERIIKLGEPKEHVHMVGCPRMDLIREILEDKKPDYNIVNEYGVGDQIDFSKPFLLVFQYPVTSEYGHGKEQMFETLEAVEKTGMQALVLWPNADAGAEDVSKAMRMWREQGRAKKMRFHKNLPIEIFSHIMNDTACMVGNSSAGLRDGSFIGTPYVNIGNRQAGRERGKNILDVGYDANEIYKGIKKQLEHGKYNRETIFGDGHAGPRIADILFKEKVNIQKRNTF